MKKSVIGMLAVFAICIAAALPARAQMMQRTGSGMIAADLGMAMPQAPGFHHPGGRLAAQEGLAADIDAYDKGHAHMLMFADMLTHGIVKQFPAKFKS